MRRPGSTRRSRIRSAPTRRGIASVHTCHQCYRYPFYGFNSSYLSNYLDYVEALLGFNGYEKNIGVKFSSPRLTLRQ